MIYGLTGGGYAHTFMSAIHIVASFTFYLKNES